MKNKKAASHGFFSPFCAYLPSTKKSIVTLLPVLAFSFFGFASNASATACNFAVAAEYCSNANVTMGFTADTAGQSTYPNSFFASIKSPSGTITPQLYSGASGSVNFGLLSEGDYEFWSFNYGDQCGDGVPWDANIGNGTQGRNTDYLETFTVKNCVNWPSPPSGENEGGSLGAAIYPEILGNGSIAKIGIGTQAPETTLHVAGGGIFETNPLELRYFDVADYNVEDSESYVTTKAYVDAQMAVVSTDTINDADGNTVVQVEESANENKIRFDTDGSERMVIDESGNVGIGTTSPDAPLHVKTDSTDATVIVKATGLGAYASRLQLTASGGDMGGNSYIDFGDEADDNAGFIRYEHLYNAMTFSSAGGNGLMVLDANGNVGIGTTNPSGKLDIKAESGQDGINSFRVPNNTGAFTGGTVGTWLGFSAYNDDSNFIGAIGASNSQTFEIQSNSGEGLSINGQGWVTADDRLIIGSTGSLSAPSLTLDNTSGDESGFYVPNTNEIAIITDRTERMRIDDIGNVGIGTDSPDFLLDVEGGVKLSNDNKIVWGEIGAGEDLIFTSLQDSPFFVNSGDFEGMTFERNIFTLKQGGNVGIGTTDPQANLHMVNSFDAGPVPTTLRLAHWNLISHDTDGLLPDIDNRRLSISSATTGNGLTIQHDGNVGVGVASPTEKLEVNGNIKINGTVSARDSVFLSATDAPASLMFSSNNLDMYTGSVISHGLHGGLAYSSSGHIFGTHNASEAMKINLSGKVSLTKNFELPETTDSSTGVILKNGNRFIHNFKVTDTGGFNTFLGKNSGNFSMSKDGWLFHASHNTAAGENTLSALTTGNHNTAIGSHAMQNTTTGQFNSALGQGALQTNTTGQYNTALGLGTLSSSSTAEYNTAVGHEALTATTLGTHNTAVGSGALQNNTEGGYNTAIGLNAMSANLTATHNSALGTSALSSNTTGSGNTALGIEALYNANADYNIALGMSSLRAVTSGNENIAIGTYTGDNITTGSNNITIGHNIKAASATGSNQLNIGDAIYGDLSSGLVGIGTSNPVSNLEVENASGDAVVRIDAQTDSNSRIYFSEANTTSWSVGSIGSNNELTFYNASAGTTPFRIESGALNNSLVVDITGNVGIGTTTPSEKLDVNGDVLVEHFSTPTLTVKYGKSAIGVGDAAIKILSDGAMNSHLYLGDVDDEDKYLIRGDKFNNRMSFHTGDSGTARIVIKDSGNVGIGTTDPQEILDVDGNILADAYLYSSDERLKENIRPMSINSLENILKVQTADFEWIETGKTDTGFIAQDLEQHFPQFVHTNEETGFKTVDYTKMVVPLVESVQQLSAEIDALRAEIETLKAAQ